MLPDPLSGECFAAFGEENLTGGDFVFFGELEQLPAQLSGQEDRADLPLQRDIGPTRPRGLHGDVPDLGHPDAGSADGLQQQLHLTGGRRHQAGVIAAGEIAGGVPEGAALELQEPDPAAVPAQEVEQSVDGGESGVDGSRGKALVQQMGLPLGGSFPGHRPAIQPCQKRAGGVSVFLDRSGGALLLLQQRSIIFNVCACQDAVFHPSHHRWI